MMISHCETYISGLTWKEGITLIKEKIILPYIKDHISIDYERTSKELVFNYDYFFFVSNFNYDYCLI